MSDLRSWEFKGKGIDAAQIILTQTCLAYSPFIESKQYDISGDGNPLLRVTAIGWAFSSGEEVLLDVLAAVSVKRDVFAPADLERLDASTASTAYAALGVAFVPAINAVRVVS